MKKNLVFPIVVAVLFVAVLAGAYFFYMPWKVKQEAFAFVTENIGKLDAAAEKLAAEQEADYTKEESQVSVHYIAETGVVWYHLRFADFLPGWDVAGICRLPDGAGREWNNADSSGSTEHIDGSWYWFTADVK